MFGLKLTDIVVFIGVFICVSIISGSTGMGVFAGGLAFFLFRKQASGNSFGGQRDDKLDYILEILALVSVILTNDKKILNSELNYVKRFLSQNFSDEEAKSYLLKFREYTKKDFSVEKICVRLNQSLDNSEKRQILHLIIGAAVADRELTESELKTIYTIGHKMRIGPLTVKSLLSMHTFSYSGGRSQQYERQNNGQRQYRQSNRSSAPSLSHAYRVLEITPQATETEIKKAYRKLAIIYHPDKVASMGESYQNSAKEKFQKIQTAYEQVKTARGIN